MIPGLVDIIIVNHNSRRHIRRCLHYIRLHTQDVHHRNIVIDNASTDGSASFLRSLRGITLVANGANLGTTKAWNQGINLGQGEFILLLNPDVQVTPGWLARMVGCMQQDSAIAVVGCKNVKPDGIILHAGMGFNGRVRGRGLVNRAGLFDQQEDCLAISGGCMLLRRAYLPILGLFDERYFMYFEDLDYCWQARSKGYRVVYCPVTVLHQGHGSPMDNKKRNSIILRSRQLFRQKWINVKAEGKAHGLMVDINDLEYP
ncbi:MAG: glycosyltransferase family 2 protein [Clostridia bacterium]|nr:glycosyltransferase family 2 protein [Clostridia bacterium]